ncbi:PAS domain S-box protein [Candidatus Pacearchaeota archaeon]|nr:PAS domain S-box protein [Candidatus Pacearchaeota archaeon]
MSGGKDEGEELKEVMKEEKKLDEELQVDFGKNEYFEKFIFEKEKMKRIKERLAYYKKTIKDSNDAIIIQDFNGRIKSWNHGAERIYGFKEREMIGKSIFRIIDKEYREVARKNIEAVRNGKPTFRVSQIRKRKDGGRVDVWITYSPIYEDEEIIEIATTEQDITKSLKSVEDLRISEEKLSLIMKSIPEGMDIVDEKCNILWANDYILERLGKRMVGKKCYEMYKDDKKQCEYCPLKKGVKVGESKSLIIRGVMGGEIMEVSHIGIIYEGKKAILEIFRDVTNEVNSKYEIERINRALRVIAESNLAILRSVDEIELIERVCNIIVHIGKYKMVWVGVAKHDEGKSVDAIAQAGFVKGYLKDLNITWKDSERGRGPTGRAIRSGKVVVCKNILEDPKFKPWREEAIKRGYVSSICVPFRVSSKEVLVMNIYSRYKNVFDQKEVKLLVGLAESLSRGIISLRNKIETKRVEEVMRLKDRLIRQTGKMALVGGWEFDARTLEGTWTEETARIHDLDPKKKTNVKSGLSFYHGEYRKKIEKALEEAIKKGVSYDLELEMVSAKGVHKWVRTIGGPVRKKGKIVKIRGSFQDITEMKMVELKLMKINKKYSKLFDESADAIFIADPKTKKLTDCNERALKLTGYSKEEIVGMRADDLHPKDKAEKVMEGFVRQAKGEKISVETEILKKDKKTRVPVTINSSLIQTNGGLEIQGIFRDMTEKKKIEESLIEEKEKAQRYLDLAGVIILNLNSKGEVTMINKRGAEILEAGQEEIIGKNWFSNFVPWNMRAEVKRVFHKLMLGENHFVRDYENFVLTKTKKEKLISWHNTLLRDDSKVIGILSSGEDITEKKRIEVELRESEERNRQIFKQSPVAKFAINKNHEIIAWNRVLEVLTGVSSKKMLGTKNQWKPFYPKKRFVMADLIMDGKISEIYKLYKGKGRKSELVKDAYEGIDFFPSIGKSGAWLHFTAAPLRDSNGKIIGALETIEDITVQKLAELELAKLREELEEKVKERTSELEESEMKFKTLYESSKDAIMILESPTWRFSAGNPATFKMFKAKDEKEFVSKTPIQLSPKYQSDGELSSKKAMKMINIAMKEGANFFEWTHKRLSGEEFPATVSLIRMKIKNKNVLQATVRDITERKRILDSLRESNEELKELDVVKSDFLNMISHELKTPLTAVSAHLEILMDRDFKLEKEDKDAWFESMGAIKRNNNQLKILISNLLEVSRLQSKTFELNISKVDAGEVALEVVAGLGVLAEQSGVEIVTEMHKIPKISVDRDRLVEIFNNLILNAIKFTDKGFIEIKGRKKGGFVFFDIIDSGVGIKKSQLPHLFEKFYQTGEAQSRKYAGSGLGLSITKQLLELQGGMISVKSVYGKGSTFTIGLPIRYRKSDEYIALGKNATKEGSGVIAVEKGEVVKTLNPLEKEGEFVDKLFEKVGEKNV